MVVGTCQPGNGLRGGTNTKPWAVSDPLSPLVLPLPSTLNHLQCTHLKCKSRTTMLVPVPSSGCCYLLDGSEVSAFVLFRVSPPWSPQHPAVPCTLLPWLTSFQHGWMGHPAPLCIPSYLGNREDATFLPQRVRGCLKVAAGVPMARCHCAGG